MTARQRVAVVVFNLGGPDTMGAVRPFLLNLFRDPLILRMPSFLRAIVARLIVWRRIPTARGVYAKLGGGSPILANTRLQAEGLSLALARARAEEFRVFVAMRYWHPMATEVAAEVGAYQPDRIVLIPLYPQFSTTTTESFLRVWRRAAQTMGLTDDVRTVCCFPEQPAFIRSLARLTRAGIEEARRHGRPRVLFSAHGLPRKIIESGDPYQSQVERTVAAVHRELTDPDCDYVLCFQSRVGPLEWIKPYTVDEIRRAGVDRAPVVVVPVAFVSEHSETLVELDEEYRRLAQDCGVPCYVRVPTVSVDAEFIDGLAALVTRAMVADVEVSEGTGGVRCASAWTSCLLRESAR